MPRYRYLCAACNTERTITHLFAEIIEDCELCGEKECMTKLLSKPLYRDPKKNSNIDTKKVGDLTKEYIEQNREILNTMKEKAKEGNNDAT